MVYSFMLFLSFERKYFAASIPGRVQCLECLIA
uniref:Uncharacterized protein n=1 Tax=Anguilla anguilla TaxID=7936 RepID=A0A0E9T387_ANGAN